MDRRKYYDIFSHFYDFVIRLHSRDESGEARSFLSKKVGVRDGLILDICTGTGSAAIETAQICDSKVIGIDFSRGMIKKATEKSKDVNNISFVIGDVSRLPFQKNVFSSASCSHAFYEVKGEKKKETLREIKRVLKNGGKFCMMEHDIPKSPLVKIFFYIRLLSLGKKEALSFLREEMNIFREYFVDVTKENTPSGKSKLLTGRKSP